MHLLPSPGSATPPKANRTPIFRRTVPPGEEVSIEAELRAKTEVEREPLPGKELKNVPTRGSVGSQRTSVRATSEREAKSPSTSPLTKQQEIIRDTLLKDHPELGPDIESAKRVGYGQLQEAGFVQRDRQADRVKLENLKAKEVT